MGSDTEVESAVRRDRSWKVQFSALAVGLALIVTLFAAMPAQSEAKGCGLVTIGNGWSWVVGGDGMSCQKMRKWSSSMIRGKGKPKGWRCQKRGKGPSQSGGCSRGPNGTSPFFIYYPPH
jgi:hypothetical protein